MAHLYDNSPLLHLGRVSGLVEEGDSEDRKVAIERTEGSQESANDGKIKNRTGAREDRDGGHHNGNL